MPATDEVETLRVELEHRLNAITTAADDRVARQLDEQSP